MKNINKIWIDEDFFDGEIDVIESVFDGEIENLQKAYRIWEEAHNTIVKSGENEELFNQGFIALKRAFNVISKVLKKEFGLHNISYTGRTKSFFSTLEHFDIMKKNTLKEYVNLRNILEHDEEGEISEKYLGIIFSEYIWAYIRIASSLLTNKKSEVIYINNKYGIIKFHFIVEKNNDDYYPKIKVMGYVNVRKISYIQSRSNILIEDCKVINNAKEYISSGDFLEIKSLDDNFNKMLFEGVVKDPDIMVNYIKQMVLPERWGLVDENQFKRIFYK